MLIKEVKIGGEYEHLHPVTMDGDQYDENPVHVVVKSFTDYYPDGFGRAPEVWVQAYRPDEPNLIYTINPANLGPKMTQQFI